MFEVLPIPQIPQNLQKYINQTPPAGITILAKRTSAAGSPEAAMGSALPPDKISPYSGIYGPDGKLPRTPAPGMTFVAKV
jgi:hypothetical protein